MWQKELCVLFFHGVLQKAERIPSVHGKKVFQPIAFCRSRKTETLNQFVSRFRGLAEKHMIHVVQSQNSQIGEVLAITLLNNADLPESTLTNDKLQLKGLLKPMEEASRLSFRIAPPQLETLVSLNTKIRSLADKMDPGSASGSDSSNVNLASSVGQLRQATEYIKSITDYVQQTRPPPASVIDRILELRPRIQLKLDDAARVLRSLARISPVFVQHMSKNDIQTLVSSSVQKA